MHRRLICCLTIVSAKVINELIYCRVTILFTNKIVVKKYLYNQGFLELPPGNILSRLCIFKLPFLVTSHINIIVVLSY
jgi:hypothetical protein